MCTYCGSGLAPLVTDGLCVECVALHMMWACESRPNACDACSALERAGIVIDRSGAVSA